MLGFLVDYWELEVEFNLKREKAMELFLFGYLRNFSRIILV